MQTSQTKQNKQTFILCLHNPVFRPAFGSTKFEGSSRRIARDGLASPLDLRIDHELHWEKTRTIYSINILLDTS